MLPAGVVNPIDVQLSPGRKRDGEICQKCALHVKLLTPLLSMQTKTLLCLKLSVYLQNSVLVEVVITTTLYMYYIVSIVSAYFTGAFFLFFMHTR